MKAVAELWRQATPEEKSYWNEQAVQDKARYQREMENYDGPLTVENVR